MRRTVIRTESRRIAATVPSRESGGRRPASHGDDELSPSVSFSLVSESFRNLTQLVAAIDHRREFSGLDELLENRKILSVMPHDEHAHPLTDERRQREQLDLTSESEPTAHVRDSNQDVCPPGCQSPPAV